MFMRIVKKKHISCSSNSVLFRGSQTRPNTRMGIIRMSLAKARLGALFKTFLPFKNETFKHYQNVECGKNGDVLS
jgi:hypothetical protein